MGAIKYLADKLYSNNKEVALVGVGPAGVGFDHYGVSAPTGALACNGQELSKTTYAALYSAIGDVWATTGGVSAPGAGNFRLPPQQMNSLGLYNRGVSTNVNVGDYQDMETEDLVAMLQLQSNEIKHKRRDGLTWTSAFKLAASGAYTASTVAETRATEVDAIKNLGATSAQETRPKSITVLKCIWTGATS